MWFGASIVFTAIVVGTLFRVLAPTDRWRPDAGEVERFISARIADIWDDPEARERFVHDAHRDLKLDTALRDARGALIERAGRPCEEPWAKIPIHRDGERLGELEVCGQPYPWSGWRFLLVLLVAICILWAASGILARRLVRPLRKLEAMARRIGEGDLSARSNLTTHRHGELGTLGETMDEMAARIEKQLADQRELLAAVSHELRTPLGHLRVLIDMAREKPARIDEIEREILEMDALVGQLLASSRLDFGTLELSRVDGIELAERALERVGLQSDRLAVEGEPRPFEADPTLVSRAIANLLANACGHGGGVEVLEVRYEAERVVFAVEDRGPGIPTEEREQVFQAFYRGQHRAGASLGLGLSLVRRIAQAHRGTAWIEDVEGGGARVLFSIAA
jgi:signal transduction histidine kinase